MGNARKQTSGTSALDVYAKRLGLNVTQAKIPLEIKPKLEDRLKDCKTRLQAIKWVIDQVRPRDFTPISIGFFERLLREEILNAVLTIPKNDAIKYLKAKDAVEENIRKAIKYLNLALDELERTESGGSKSDFYDYLIACSTHLETVLEKWDVPLPPNRK